MRTRLDKSKCLNLKVELSLSRPLARTPKADPGFGNKTSLFMEEGAIVGDDASSYCMQMSRGGGEKKSAESK